MAATTALLLLFAHAAAPFAHASHARSNLDVADTRIPARRLLDAGDQQATAMQQHSRNSRQTARSLLQVANATIPQASGQAAGQGAGQGAGSGAGQGAGQGAGAGAGQATAPPATLAGTAGVSTVAGTPPFLPPPATPAGPAQQAGVTGPAEVIITDRTPTAVVTPQGAGPAALGTDTPAVSPGNTSAAVLCSSFGSNVGAKAPATATPPVLTGNGIAAAVPLALHASGRTSGTGSADRALSCNSKLAPAALMAAARRTPASLAVKLTVKVTVSRSKASWVRKMVSTSRSWHSRAVLSVRQQRQRQGLGASSASSAMGASRLRVCTAAATTRGALWGYWRLLDNVR